MLLDLWRSIDVAQIPSRKLDRLAISHGEYSIKNQVFLEFDCHSAGRKTEIRIDLILTRQRIAVLVQPCVVIYVEKIETMMLAQHYAQWYSSSPETGSATMRLTSMPAFSARGRKMSRQA